MLAQRLFCFGALFIFVVLSFTFQKLELHTHKGEIPVCFYKFNIHKLNKRIQTKEGENHVMVQNLLDI
jgi:hypothetical protein